MPMRIFTFKNFRIFLLVIILAAVALYSKDQRMVTQGWYKPLNVVIFPINANGSDEVDSYIENLSDKDFTPIDTFIQRESKRYDIVTSTPTNTTLGDKALNLPPKPPGPSAIPIKIAFWSLQLRWWAMQNTPDGRSNKHRVRVYVIYHEVQHNMALEHSLGLQKGLLGVVHAFASKKQTKQNNIVIAHELLHTVGATDKYDSIGNPVVPDGLAEPDRSPLYPQRRAEIMAGSVASSATNSKMAKSLKRCVLGKKTAFEIGWMSN